MIPGDAAPRLPDNPRVVACVPAYNAAGFVEATLRSLADQTYENLRVIVSVDRCEDDTAKLCEAFAARDERFTVVSQYTRLGWVGNTNAALAHADGDLVFVAAHDDQLRPTYIERLCEELQRRPSAVLAFSDVKQQFPDGTTEIVTYAELEGLSDPVARALRLNTQGDGWWVPFRGLFPTWALSRFGGLRRHWAGEFEADWPFLLNLALLGEFVRVDEPLCVKNVRLSSVSRTWEYSKSNRLSVTLACVRQVIRAELPSRDRIALVRPLLRSAGELAWAQSRWQVAQRWP